MFAVIETGAKQYLIKTGDVVKIEKLDVEPGKEVVFDRVLLTASEDGTDVKIGAPYLSGVSITATVESQIRTKKIVIVKFKNKVRYRRSQGHKQKMTKVKVKAV